MVHVQLSYLDLILAVKDMGGSEILVKILTLAWLLSGR